MHSTRNTALVNRCAAVGLRICRTLQQHPFESAIGYVTPKDMLGGRQQEIHDERDRKLAEARQQRQIRRQQAA
jgi:hypothetical protein